MHYVQPSKVLLNPGDFRTENSICLSYRCISEFFYITHIQHLKGSLLLSNSKSIIQFSCKSDKIRRLLNLIWEIWEICIETFQGCIFSFNLSPHCSISLYCFPQFLHKILISSLRTNNQFNVRIRLFSYSCQALNFSIKGSNFQIISLREPSRRRKLFHT